MIVTSPSAAHNSLILATGSFQSRKLIEGLAADMVTGGAKKTVYDGIDVMVGSTGDALAFPDDRTAMLGSESLIRSVIDRRKLKGAKRAGNASILNKVQTWMEGNDLWFASAGPANDFTGEVGARATGGVLNSSILKAFDRTYGGLKFSDSVEVGVETTARSEKDATSMVRAMRLLSALGQMTRGATNGPLGFLESLDIKSNGNIVNFKLTIPKSAFDAMNPADRDSI